MITESKSLINTTMTTRRTVIWRQVAREANNGHINERKMGPHVDRTMGPIVRPTDYGPQTTGVLRQADAWGPTKSGWLGSYDKRMIASTAVTKSTQDKNLYISTPGNNNIR